MFRENNKNRNLLIKKIASVMIAVAMIAALLPVSAAAEATQEWITWGTPNAVWVGSDESGADLYEAAEAVAFTGETGTDVVITYTVNGGQKKSHVQIQDAQGNPVEGAAVDEPDGASRTATISGLEPATTYRLFWDCTDNTNLTCNVYLTFTTEAVEPIITGPTQTWITWGTPMATWTGSDETGADLYTADEELFFNNDNNVVITYTVNKSVTKSHAQLLDAEGNAVVDAVIEEPDASERTATISGLKPETTYQLFWDNTDNKNLECNVYLTFTTEAVSPGGEGDHTVIFDSNGGSDVKQQIVKDGETAEKPEDPKRSGYNFIEWQLNGETYDFTTPVVGDLTLIAVWELTGPDQRWISFENKTPAVSYWKTEIIDEKETDFYKADEDIELNSEGKAFIYYSVPGQQRYLPATLRNDQGETLAYYEFDAATEKYSLVVVGEGISFDDSLSNDRTVTIGGLAANTQYQLYWPKLGANNKNPQRDVILVFTTAEFDTGAIRIDSGVEEKYVYTGSEIKPVPVVKVNQDTLVIDQDYDITYSEDCINVGEKTLTVTGKGAYEGKTVSATYKITKATLKDAQISFPDSAGTLEDGTVQYAYTGSEVKPEPVVTLNDQPLVKGTDYDLAYTQDADLINAEEGKVLTVSINARPNSNFKDAQALNYTIVPKKLTPAVTLSKDTVAYNGKLRTPTVTVKDGETVLVKNTDYTVSYADGRIDAGKYSVKVTLKGNYEGAKTVSFTITPKKITPKVTLSCSAYAFAGKARKPVPTVYDGTTVLTKDTDYKVTYASGRTNVGKYSVKVTLKGNYEGTKTVYFKINPKGTSISALTAGTKNLTVTWKKQADKMADERITGYQIQYSLSKDFTSPTLLTVKGYTQISKQIKSLTSGKTYYVRVRTYMKVNDDKFYSAWSTAKNVKVK